MHLHARRLRSNHKGEPRLRDPREFIVKDPLEDKFEALAQCAIDFKDAVARVAQGLPDDEVLRLAELARKNGFSGEDVFGRGYSKNFSIPIWEEIAQALRSEVGMRRIVCDAEAYMERTGATVYCVHCKGACRPEHQAEL